MIRVNLVPLEIMAKSRQRQLMLQAALVGGALGVVLVFASLVHWFGLYRLQDDFAYKESKFKKLAAIVAQVEELEKAAAAVRARLGVIEDLLKGRGYYPIFMSDFARTVPPGVRVMALTTSSQGGGVLRLTILGQSSSGEEIAAWVKSLEKSPRFQAPQPELGPVTASGKLFSFSMTASYTNK